MQQSWAEKPLTGFPHRLLAVSKKTLVLSMWVSALCAKNFYWLPSVDPNCSFSQLPSVGSSEMWWLKTSELRQGRFGFKSPIGSPGANFPQINLPHGVDVNKKWGRGESCMQFLKWRHIIFFFKFEGDLVGMRQGPENNLSGSPWGFSEALKWGWTLLAFFANSLFGQGNLCAYYSR